MKAMFAVVALSAAAFAQEPNQRYEFLWRLRQLEMRWHYEVQDNVRAEALASVVKAQAQYASARVQECCAALDDAASSMGGYVVAKSLSPLPSRRLCDSSEPTLSIWVAVLFPAAAQPVHFTGRLDSDDSTRLDKILGPPATPKTWTASLDLNSATIGDRELALCFEDGKSTNCQRAMTISIVEHRDERLAALKASIEKLTDKAPALERETARATLALLESLAHGSTEAHEYPGARLLAETEQVVAAAAKGERWYTAERSGEFWLSLPIDGASVRTRVLVPEGLSKDKSAPLVVAFHGAAFDEDVWFDGYGAGAAVELARQRGWIFAAMHCEGEDSAKRVEAVIDALSRVYPVDAKRVFLLGHSRGTRAALRAQAAGAERYCGVAAIGNALDDASAKALANHPLFLAAGDHDAAREAVTAMSKTLTDAGSKTVVLTIYPNTEHWLAVQAALPDAFAWFDSLAK